MSNGDIFYRKGYGSLWMYENGHFVKINDGLIMDLDKENEFVFVGHIAWYAIKSEIDKLDSCPDYE